MLKRLIVALALGAASAGLAAERDGFPPSVPVSVLFSDEMIQDEVCLEGCVTDAFPDEVDPRFVCFIVDCEGKSVLASVFLNGERPEEALAMIGRPVRMCGRIRSTSSIVSRAYLGRMLNISDLGKIRVLDAAWDPFAVPELKLSEGIRPDRIVSLGKRRVTGRVIAVWGGRHALVRPERGRPIRLELVAGADLPDYGEEIECVGVTATDTYFIRLSAVQWRPRGGSAAGERDVHPMSARDLLTDGRGGERFRMEHHGLTVRVAGIVRGISDIDRGRFVVEDGDRLVTVDASSLPGASEKLTRGCTVEVTGTCVLDIEEWQPNRIVPRIRGLSVVPNYPSDIVVLASAPWLTPDRAWLIFGALAAFLVCFFVWNRMLWFKAFRRGRALSAEILARAEADMRTRERTRLAVELHDSLVQYLSGVIMELECVRRIAPDTENGGHLDRAVRTLRSCHAELRNCLWDLRSEALEEPDMTAAIKRTLVPHAKGIALDVRFNFPRVRLSDNTAHMILRIVRELTLNGIRHGGADRIKIAGAVDGETLKISVRDNGSGYDPARAPGVADGHFGLEGIRERIRGVSGSFTIEPRESGGTRAVITIPLPKEEKQ